MSINTGESYIEIGTRVKSDKSLSNCLRLPAPVKVPSSNEFMATAERNANGTMMIQQVGRTQYTTELTFRTLRNVEWWAINRWFETYGYVFYMKYFSHTDGKVKIQRFYRGNVSKCNPSTMTEVMKGISVPKYYTDCGFNIIDMGENNVITVTEMEVS